MESSLSAPATLPPEVVRSTDELEEAIVLARDALLEAQHADGHWCFELEADCTIPAEYVLMMHYLGEVDQALQKAIGGYLRERQRPDGGWPLYHGGASDVSCSVKVYYALKLAGDALDAPHMVRARKAILALGGAARANVFTRITLALFRQLPWRAVPFIPVECVLLPRWFPFHLDKVSYWSRTVMVPLLILCALKPAARNPERVDIRELFVVDPDQAQNYFPVRSPRNRVYLALDRLARRFEPIMPRKLRSRALKAAEAWMCERLNGDDGLGAIFPAMVNALEALDALGYPPQDSRRAAAKRALERLIARRGVNAYCQPCFPPVWDTALACHALIASGRATQPVRRGLDWLVHRQLSDDAGDWRTSRPTLAGGGWPFQYRNSHYPDVDDTAAIVWAMQSAKSPGYETSIARAIAWLKGMQSKGGGFGAFDVDNTHAYLNDIPFADHGALLDPPTADVSGRCLAALCGMAADDAATRAMIADCIAYLRAEQEPSGCWFGRWGTNYIYGTWSVLTAFEVAGIPASDPAVRRAVDWLKEVQRSDGGWGESNDTYLDPALAGQGDESTSFQTAWAMLALMAAGERDCEAVRRGAGWLVRRQGPDGFWHDDAFTAPGFPRVFYLKYHGYGKYFPLWALARYRNEGKPGA